MLELEFLDKIISILKINHKLTASQINTHFITDSFYKIYADTFNVTFCLEKLISDNYVKEIKEVLDIKGFDNESLIYYVLTSQVVSFEGYANRNFFELATRKQNELLKLSQVKLNDSSVLTNASVRRTNCLMVILTSLIALGTVIAAVYYIFQILSVHLHF